VKRLRRDARDLGVTLDERTAGTLVAYEELLRDRAVPLGLVSESDARRIRERHVMDCLRATLAFRAEDRTAYDLGSGAGLPGIVLACALPDRSFRLVEAKGRAAGFLELAVDRLPLENVEVLVRRVEDLEEPVDLITARAFAPLERAWEAARPLLRPGGRLVYFAGSSVAPLEEIAGWLEGPEPPLEVEFLGRVESGAPLVIMSRRG